MSTFFRGNAAATRDYAQGHALRQMVPCPLRDPDHDEQQRRFELPCAESAAVSLVARPQNR
jgi:hypothetical protein